MCAGPCREKPNLDQSTRDTSVLFNEVLFLLVHVSDSVRLSENRDRGHLGSVPYSCRIEKLIDQRHIRYIL